jgi:hypothetical protein
MPGQARHDVDALPQADTAVCAGANPLTFFARWIYDGAEQGLF